MTLTNIQGANGAKTLVRVRPRGFCAGVVRAVDIVELALEAYGRPVYVHHEIVHNRYVVDQLRRRGAIFVETIGEVPTGAVLVFSAHGVPPRVRMEAQERELKVIDATCPLVTKVHLEALKFAREGRTLILIGHRDHQEIVGTSGEAPDQTIVVGNVEEVDQLEVPDPSRLAFLTQTTLSLYDTQEIVARLRQRFPLIVGPASDDICYATQNRQEAVEALTREVELILVVGSANSSNSNRLVEVAQRAGVAARLLKMRTMWTRPGLMASIVRRADCRRFGTGGSRRAGEPAAFEFRIYEPPGSGSDSRRCAVYSAAGACGAAASRRMRNWPGAAVLDSLQGADEWRLRSSASPKRLRCWAHLQALPQQRRGAKVRRKHCAAAGLAGLLQSSGYEVTDLGDDPLQLYQTDDQSPRARNIPRVLASIEALKPRVEIAVKSGALPLILSGDSSIALATVAGARRYFRHVGIVYLDRDAGLHTPATTTTGSVDGMVVSHLAGRGAAELVRFWGEPPLVREPDLAIFGVERIDATEDEALLRSPVRRYLAADIKRTGAVAAAEGAAERIQAGGHDFVLHLDVDVIADFQATDNPGTDGLSLDEVRDALEVFAKQKHLAAIEVTGYNPAKDSDGSGAKLILDLVTGVLAKRLEALNAAAAAAAESAPAPAGPVLAAAKVEQKAEQSIEPSPEPSTEPEQPAVIPGEAWSSGPDEDLEPTGAPETSDAEPPEASEEPDHSHS